MKIAVSIPNPIFRAAERLAKSMGVSRSRLYARALEAYLDRQRRAEVTAALERIYGTHPELSELPEELRRLQGASILRERW